MEVKLNSPCGKFKITNMVDNQVDLTTEEEIEKLTITLLKFRLKCCHINQNGNKKKMLER